MSGALCALWIGLVSLATVCLVISCPSLTAVSSLKRAIPSRLVSSDYSQLNLEASAASQDGALAALFQLAIRWEHPPSLSMAGGVRAPHVLHLNSKSSARPPLAVSTAVEKA